MGSTVYDIDKLEVLANFLSIEIDSIHVWSDNSLTVGSNDNVEFFVTKGKRKYSELVGRSGKFNIYRNN